MKNISLCLLLIALITSCNIDYMDINTNSVNSENNSELNLNVFVSGNMISSKSQTNDKENTVKSLDLFVFAVTSDGVLLEYQDRNVIPNKSELQSSTNDICIYSSKIELPTSGTKYVVVVGNSQNVQYPQLKCLSETDKSEEATSYEQFQQGLSFSLNDLLVPQEPFMMLGKTIVSNAQQMTVPVRLARQFAKLEIVNHSSSLSEFVIQGIQIIHTPNIVKPLLNDFSKFIPEFVDMEIVDVTSSTNIDPFYLLFSPGSNDKSDYRTKIKISGLLNGVPYDSIFNWNSPIYPDYNYIMSLSVDNNMVYSKFTPDWSEGSFSVSGMQLQNNKLIFSWIAEKNWGYELSWTTDMSGKISVEKLGSEDWYSVAVDDNLIRICCLTDNTGEERTASFKVVLGKKSQTIQVIQQPCEFNTVSFNGMIWLDRNFGATLPSDEQNITNPFTYGYYYQWGRNIPFPTFGDVDKIESSASITIENANSKKEFITSSGDWMVGGIPIIDKVSVWKDRSFSEPCPQGYHIPSYREYQCILPYTNATGVGNFSSLKYVLKTGEILDDSGVEYESLYVTSGKEDATIYAIKKYGTESAYILRLQRIASSGSSYLRIDCKKGNSKSDFSGADASSKLISAKALFEDETNMETLFFPASGRRDRLSSNPIYQGLAANNWSATVWTGNNSSSLWYDPVESNTRIYNMANSRGHALPIRCIKDK